MAIKKVKDALVEVLREHAPAPFELKL